MLTNLYHELGYISMQYGVAGLWKRCRDSLELELGTEILEVS